MEQAIDIYRENFKPSEQLEKPHVMLGYNVCAAESFEEAHLLRSSSLQSFVNMRKGAAGKLPPPIANYEATLSASERQMLNQMARCAAVGDPETIETQIKRFLRETEADELIIVSSIFNHEARLQSYALTAEVAKKLH